MELPEMYIMASMNRKAIYEVYSCLIHLYGYKSAEPLSAYKPAILIFPGSLEFIESTSDLIKFEPDYRNMIGYTPAGFLKTYSGIGMTRIK